MLHERDGARIQGEVSGRLRVIGKANVNCGSCINAAWLKDAGAVLFAIMKMELPPRVILTLVEEGGRG